MPKATCRCGNILEIPKDGTDRMVCPECGAKVRIRHAPKGESRDGFVRFDCPCGRRLKVRESNPMQTSGKCPDCGRVVPVPAATSPGNFRSHGASETPTDEMNAVETAAIEKWSAGYRESPPTKPIQASGPLKTASATKSEAGLRVCPKCGRPVHLSAVACRECGASVPKR